MPLAALKKITLKVAVVVFLSGFIACKANLDQSADQVNSKVSEAIPKILFLTYTIKKTDSGQSVELTLVNKIKSDGKLKTSSNDLKRGKSGDLVCIQLDNKKGKLDEVVVDNPLIKQVEYANQQGELAKKIINQSQTQFSIRLQLMSDTKYIRIDQIGTPEEKNNELLISKL